MSGRRAKGSHFHAEAREHLAQGYVVVMAPEGLRSWAGQIHRVDVDVARLALDAGALVVPAHVADGNLVLGSPVDLSRHAATPHSHAVVRAAADDIALALCELTGLTYRDHPAVRGDLRPRPLIWLSHMRKLRRDRKRLRQVEQERLRQESARDAEELAREEEKARLAAQLQARKASLADRLAEHDIRPGR
ncbi:1-acyl-sn-glycerol-3-phosphate acyltransferase [Cutibacterium equinum]|uniref:1-acyl-sn-glycerol-3-phosphate acyltransferase n=1 Tax=Cutibacterium equinum TaxID=3016342 RepID=A0ABY7R166_9ACTN|nr:1-acyl-sn-glycerol-3-phosphate acyltransferase [Cutibacterium equinum]WCC81028.1 1-acyl-sn-glycerol-3-phosphate acyltransferase [Cutibacterium equinum]